MSTVKRLFLYIVAIVNLGIFAGGAGNLLALVFDLISADTAWRDYAQVQLALGLAMLIIGGTLWFLFWRIIQKAVAADDSEVGSGVRKFYLNLVLVVTAITGLSSLAGFLRWLLTGVPLDEFPSVVLGMIIITGSLWFYHRNIEKHEGQPTPVAKTLHRWYVYILSAFGLVSLTTVIVTLLNSSFQYLPLWGDYTIRGGLWEEVLSGNISWMITGGTAWWYYWFRLAKGDYDSTLRQVYLYLLTITGGVLAALSALTTVFYHLFGLAFTDRYGDQYFLFLGWTIPTILVATAVWLYHRSVVKEEAEYLKVNRLSPHRIYLYLMSFIGLGTMLSGIAFLFSVLLDLLFDAASTATTFYSGWWGEQLSVALALLLVGLPLWLYFWRRTLRLVDEGGVSERGMRSRRIYLYVVLGVTIIAAVTTLVIIVYQLINGLLGGEFGSGFFTAMVWSISILVVALPALLYHWRVLREDQRLGAERTISRKRVTVIAAVGTEETVRRIEERLGYRIRQLRYTGQTTGEIPVMPEEEIEALVSEIAETAGTGVILTLTGNTPAVLPYEET